MSKESLDTSYDFSGSLLEDDDNSELSSTPLSRSLSQEEDYTSSWLNDYSDFLLEFVFPIIWSILFMFIMDRQTFFGKSLCISKFSHNPIE
jgi:hypothetical protein